MNLVSAKLGEHHKGSSCMAATVAVIILNWNNAPDTIACIESVMTLTYPNVVTIVVDNGSIDNSIEVIKSQSDVIILETGENLGYAGGNNFGIMYAMSIGVDYIAILNNDVTVTPEFLDLLMDTYITHPETGVVAPLVLPADDMHRVWAAGQQVDWHTGKVSRFYAGELKKTVQECDPFTVDAASGAAMLVKRQVFEEAGLLDEFFYLYYEEVDWCLQAGRKGFQTRVVPEAVVYHKVSSSLGITSPAIDYYMIRNHLRFISIHWRGLARARLLLLTFFQNLITVVAFTVKTRSGQRLPHRNARLMALRDAVLGRWGEMGADVRGVCYPKGI